MTLREIYAGDYSQMRSRFLAAAEAAGARRFEYPHPLTGPRGESLASDVAVAGPEDASRVLLLISGTHGVEGAYGSACQSEFLNHLARAGSPPDVAIVCVHLINPWGAAWSRRVNEDNVDLNRNFLDWTKPPPDNPPYAPLNPILASRDWRGAGRASTEEALALAAKRLGGFDALLRVIEGGQYQFNDGLFYGGKEPVWSNRTLREILIRFIGPAAEQVIAFDLHTGAGPFGYPALLSVCETAHDGLDWGRSIFGPAMSVVMTGPQAVTDTKIAANATGYVSAAIRKALPQPRVLPLVIECGTLQPATMFEALRADHWLHLHGDLKSELAEEIKSGIRHAFIPDDDNWRETVMSRSLAYFSRALAALTAMPAAPCAQPEKPQQPPAMESGPQRNGIATVRVENLHKRFGALHVLNGLNLVAHPGDVISMIGASGSGKSTFLRCINLLEKPDSGTIAIEGEAIRMKQLTDGGSAPADRRQVERIRSRVGMVFQNFNLWPHMTVLENIIEAPIHVLKEPRSDAIEHAHALLKKVGLSEKPDAFPAQLSGGQQQRAAIARTLAMRPRLMLFDEPTSALDPELVGEVLRVIRQLAEEGNTMILVTHEMQFAREVSNHIIFLHQGRIEEEGRPQDLFIRPQSERLRQFLARIM